MELLALKNAGKDLPKRKTLPVVNKQGEKKSSKRKERTQSSDDVLDDNPLLSKLSQTDPAMALYFQTAQTWADNMRLFLQSRLSH